LEHPETFTSQPVQQVAKPQTRRVHEPVVKSTEEVSHYSENVIPINQATWRERAHVRGTVSSIRTAPSAGAPRVEVEVWDETGGISLQFLGRRELKGLEVGTTICAEGMVGEEDGALTIFNPSYELLI
jgi:RecG-like helicase